MADPTICSSSKLYWNKAEVIAISTGSSLKQLTIIEFNYFAEQNFCASNPNWNLEDSLA